MWGDDALVGQCSFLPLFFFFRLFLSSRSSLWLPSSPLFLPLFSRFFFVSSVFFHGLCRVGWINSLLWGRAKNLLLEFWRKSQNSIWFLCSFSIILSVFSLLSLAFWILFFLKGQTLRETRSLSSWDRHLSADNYCFIFSPSLVG